MPGTWTTEAELKLCVCIIMILGGVPNWDAVVEKMNATSDVETTKDAVRIHWSVIKKKAGETTGQITTPVEPAATTVTKVTKAKAAAVTPTKSYKRKAETPETDDEDAFFAPKKAAKLGDYANKDLDIINADEEIADTSTAIKVEDADDEASYEA